MSTALADNHVRRDVRLLMTESGRTLSLLHPSAADIEIRDIAGALAKLCRFTGQIGKFYSVAQHTVMVHDLVSTEARPYALLHDAAEAYIGDVSSPLKQAMRDLDCFGYDVLTDGIDRAIHTAAGLTFPVPTAIEREVKHADLVALATEWRDLRPDPPAEILAKLTELPPPFSVRIQPLTWIDAEDRFLRRFDACIRTFPSLAGMRRIA